MEDAGCQCVYVVDLARALISRVPVSGWRLSLRSSATTLRPGSTGTRTSSSGWRTRCTPNGPGAQQIDGTWCAVGAGPVTARPRCWPWRSSAERAAERYGVPAHAILTGFGEAGYVGGQEDMIIDVALQLQSEVS